MKIKADKLSAILMNFMVSIISIVVLYGISYSDNLKSFVMISRLGVTFIIIQLIVFFVYQKKFLTPFNIVLACFVLFQYGLPILYAFVPQYQNFYVEFLGFESAIEGLRISTLAIEVFILGGILGLGIKKNIINIDKEYLRNGQFIFLLSRVLFLVTGITTIPLAIVVFFLSIRYGYGYIKIDNMEMYNGITNMAKTLFIAAGFLSIVYAPTKRRKKTFIVLMLIYGGLSMASGGRTEGLPIILALLILVSKNEGKNKLTIKRFFRGLIIILLLVGILFLLTMIAQIRMGNSNVNLSLINILISTIEEMGFNFTSIGFTMEFVPNSTSFQYGGSYLNSLICLIPRSIDLFGVIDRVREYLPEIWIQSQLHSTYGSLFDFGVGYSVIAESFYNFGYFGVIAVGLQGWIIQRFFNLKIITDSRMSTYIQLIMVYGLTTYARRSFYTLEKVIEYDILLVFFLLYLAYRISRRYKAKEV